MKTSKSTEIGSRISLKDSSIIARMIKGKKVDGVKKLLEGMSTGTKNVDGKYYTKTAKKILELVMNAEANAKNRDMNVERLFVKNAQANKAEKRMLGKTKLKLRGREGKGANIEIVLEER